MKAKVTKKGVNVPRRLLGDASEVEIRKEKGNVVIIPLTDDPILGMGKDPVVSGISDGAEEHDRYLYGSAS